MFGTPPPSVQTLLLSFPKPHILLVTINRPHAMNCINAQGHVELSSIWQWYDGEPSLRCAIITGSPDGNRKAFCAGQDLKEWNALLSSSSSSSSVPLLPPTGFGGLSDRTGKKPVVAAVNGMALGGGFEMLVNADVVVASEGSTFGLPEAKIGVAASGGALPRLTMTVGLQRASELALTGRLLTAGEAREWGLVNRVVEGERVLGAALEVAEEISGNSPDSVVVSRVGVRSAWEGVGVGEATRVVREGIVRELEDGENIREGLRAFVERRKPRWVDSKL